MFPQQCICLLAFAIFTKSIDLRAHEFGRHVCSIRKPLQHDRAFRRRLARLLHGLIQSNVEGRIAGIYEEAVLKYG